MASWILPPSLPIAAFCSPLITSRSGTWESPRREVATTTADPTGSRVETWNGSGNHWAAENVRQTRQQPCHYTHICRCWKIMENPHANATTEDIYVWTANTILMHITGRLFSFWCLLRIQSIKISAIEFTSITCCTVILLSTNHMSHDTPCISAYRFGCHCTWLMDFRVCACCWLPPFRNGVRMFEGIQSFGMIVCLIPRARSITDG